MLGDVQERAGHWVWSDCEGDVEVRFVGRAPAGSDRAAVLGAVGSADLDIAWVRQIHSARVCRAAPGACGEGDALTASHPDLALSIATADCVPVVLGGGGEIAAIHAGWRGIAARIVPATVEAISVPPTHLTAWLGPAIGACCYEVGEDVAEAVAAASSAVAVSSGPSGRPHLDLASAVARQLTAAGVPEIRRVACCTRCHPELLWSYRQEGRGAGRNLAFVWRRAATAEPA